MDFLPSFAVGALLATALLLLGVFWLRARQRRSRQREPLRESLDTVAAWPPQAVRVLTVAERQAYDLLKRAMPGFLVLAQVPLSRFLRVPTRNSYTEWVQRVGLLSADLLLCDAGSQVLAVIDIRTRDETPRARARHERMVRVLQAAGIPVMTWHEGDLPGLNAARTALAPLLGKATPGIAETASQPMPLSPPEKDLSKVLADGDGRAAGRARTDEANEPVPSAFFEEYDSPGRR